MTTEAPIYIGGVPVESSNIHAIGYDPKRKILAVTFKSGHTYHYGSVPPEVHEALVQAESIGRYYAAFIKAKYPGEKVTGHCPNCGDLGHIGLECLDCGTARYAPDPDKREGA